MADVGCYLLGGGSRPISLRPGDIITLGRDRQNSIFLDDAMASRHHATITCSAYDDVALTDLGSTNKTWLNSQPIVPKKAMRLKNGDQIRIGGRIFSFVSTSEDVEPRKAAAKSSQELAQADTVSSGMRFKDGMIIMGEDDPNSRKTLALPIVASGPQPIPQPSLAGQLSEQDIPQVIQFLHQNRKTGELRIHTPKLEGLVVFYNGQVVYADCSSLSGVHAIYACARETNGTFRFDSKNELPNRPANVNSPMMEIIFECCKRLDHESRDRST